jgi:hypothetical protein
MKANLQYGKQYILPPLGLFTLVATYNFAGVIRVNKPGGIV